MGKDFPFDAESDKRKIDKSRANVEDGEGQADLGVPENFDSAESAKVAQSAVERLAERGVEHERHGVSFVPVEEDADEEPESE